MLIVENMNSIKKEIKDILQYYHSDGAIYY